MARNRAYLGIVARIRAYVRAITKKKSYLETMTRGKPSWQEEDNITRKRLEVKKSSEVGHTI